MRRQRRWAQQDLFATDQQAQTLTRDQRDRLTRLIAALLAEVVTRETTRQEDSHDQDHG